jgi:CubicO group peptidase (beta-lactamase class C family)
MARHLRRQNSVHLHSLHVLSIAATVVAAIARVSIGGDRLPAEAPTPTGTPVRAYAALDKAVMEFMDRNDCPAATAAVSLNNKPVFSRGYGWRDSQETKHTLPDALLRIGGITQSITAAAVHKLIRDGKLTGDTKVFPYLKLKPLRPDNPDHRLDVITIDQLLEHQGGWDASQYDPFLHVHDIDKTLHVKRRLRPLEVVRYMLSEPLQFDPGTQTVNSNFGYCVLGRVIEKATAKSYVNYVRDDILKPLGIEDIRGGRHFASDRDPREVWSPVKDVPVELMDSFGGLVATAPALCKFFDHYWANGQPRQLGQDKQWFFFGSIPGTTAIIRQRPDGYNIAIICSVRKKEPLTEKDEGTLRGQIDEAIDKAAAAGTN